VPINSSSNSTDTANLNKLATVIDEQREALLRAWRSQLRSLPSARHLDTPTLNDHIPVLLNELSAALRKVSEQGLSEALLEGSPPAHGQQRYEDGFDIVEVVLEYSILRHCIHDLAQTYDVALSNKALHILNRVFDEAIGLAVHTFATSQALAVRKRRQEYLAFVAHDLRTPLNAISLSASVLDRVLGGASSEPQVARMFTTLHRNVGQIKSLVEQVLKESEHLETEAGVQLERRELDLWPLVEALIYDLKPVAGTATVDLINRIPEDLRVYADAALLRRVFQNLVANAIKFTARGEVIITARVVDEGGTVECDVSDNGSGIAPDRLEIVFHKFEGNDTSDEGLGLGLAIVKTYVEAHGGRVKAESTLGVGSVLRFTLPRK